MGFLGAGSFSTRSNCLSTDLSDLLHALPASCIAEVMSVHEGGGVGGGDEYFVTDEVQPLNSCEFPNFSIMPPSRPPAPPSKEWIAFMEQYSAIDVHWIAAAPDRRFLW